jgi:hypothetical protein
MNHRTEDFRKQAYGGPAQKTLTNVLKRELIENFGFSDKLAIADLLVNRFIELYETYAPARDGVKPGQMVWLAIDADDLPARNKTMDRYKLKPVILTITCQDDLIKARNGQHPRKLLPDIIARIMTEAFDQGAVLSQYDVAVVTGRCLAYVGNAIRQWQKQHNQTLPSRGSIHDLGSTFTHKKEIVGLFLQGYKTSEIARKTGHHPVNVDRYIKDFKRVRILYQDNKKPYEIAFYTRLNEILVKEYISIIENQNLSSGADDDEKNA